MKFLLVLFISCFSRAEIHSPRPEISVLNNSEVDADKPVRLNDIATVSFVGLKQARQALDLQIVNSIADGETQKMKNTDLVKILKAKIAESSELSEKKFTYFVPEEVTIRGKKNSLSPQSVYNQITSALQNKCPDCKVTLKEVKLPQIREKMAYTSCDLQTENLKVGGSFLVPVQCSFGSDIKTFWISGSVKINKTAPVANRQISPGEKIFAKDVRMEDVDVTYSKDSAPSLEEITGQLASRMITVNQPIFKSDIKKELAITRGQVIRAISGNETFEVTSQAVAEEQGYVGDLIKIKNSESQRILSGQVIEKGVVRVQ